MIARRLLIKAGEDWWLAGGISEINAVAAYQAIGVSSIAESYNDLTGNANTIIPIIAPTWSTIDGWTFDGSTQYLTTPNNPDSDWSMIALVDNTVSTSCHFGSNSFVKRFYVLSNISGSSTQFGTGTQGIAVGLNFATTYAISEFELYEDGALVHTNAVGGNYTAGVPIWIGALNTNGTPSYAAGKIKAFAVYNTKLTPQNLLDLHNAMVAL